MAEEDSSGNYYPNLSIPKNDERCCKALGFAWHSEWYLQWDVDPCQPLHDYCNEMYEENDGNLPNECKGYSF